jgi:hypothetical protein
MQRCGCWADRVGDGSSIVERRGAAVAKILILGSARSPPHMSHLRQPAAPLGLRVGGYAGPSRLLTQSATRERNPASPFL